MITITLANGKKITDLEKNGTNFVSKTKIDEKIFENNLSTMTVDDGEITEIYHNAELIQQVQYGTDWYLAFRELTQEEIRYADNTEMLIDLQFQIDVNSLGGIQ